MTGPSDPRRFGRVRELFEAAVEMPAAQQAAWLLAECGGDEALRAEVAEILAADQVRGWSAPLLAAACPRSLPLAPGTRVGAFTIVSCIGEGGMGYVHAATQERPQRNVALKTLRSGAVPRARRRFEHECEILGRLQHPGIAQIHEAGTFHDGAGEVPYLAMELLAGAVPIDAHAATRGLDLRRVLTLFAEVCDAVQHAHQHGIVHRDLKPSNLLVDELGRVKVIDFGIALAIDGERIHRTLRTETGVVLGTFAYMSPEQLDPAAGAVDARTDVYSLGVILFQLLTGRLPHDVDTMAIPAALAVIAGQDLPRPSRYGPRAGLGRLDRELDWIAAKAAERRREDRYQTVAELGADIRRYLDDRPLEVGPPSTGYRLRKFVRRHRAAVAGAAVALVALMSGTVATALGWHRALRAEGVAQARRAELEQVAYGFWQTDRAVDRIPAIKSGGIHREILPQLDRMAAQLDSQSIERPSIEAALRLRLAHTYVELGKVGTAKTQFERALDLVSRDPQPIVEVRIQALFQLGTCLSTEGNLERALELLQEATTLTEAHGGVFADPPALPRTGIAYALFQLGRYEDAREAYDAVLRELDAREVPEPHLRYRALRGRGNARRALGDRPGARRDLEAGVAYANATLGQRDNRTLGARQDLALVLLDDPKTFAAAEAELRQVAEARAAALGACATGCTHA